VQHLSTTFLNLRALELKYFVISLLVDGDYDYEKKYLQLYIDTPESVIVLAFDGDKVVGASTAIP